MDLLKIMLLLMILKYYRINNKYSRNIYKINHKIK